MITTLLRRPLYAAALVLALPATAQEAAPQQPNMQGQPADFTQVVAEQSSAVVGIQARGLRPMQPIPGMPGMPPGFPGQQSPQQEIAALGSGFMISDQGHIVTNNHVIEGAQEIEILLADGTARPAELVGADPATDLAVLQVENSEGISVARWGDSAQMQPGAWTIAIGSPFGLGGTVTVGVLSATSRDIRSGPYDDFLQTDASINSGNSGGPLFNAAGEVVGVNTAIFSPVGGNVGIGFAVASATARTIVDQLIAGGRVQRGYIGVSLQPIDDALARAFELNEAVGALVTSVDPEGAAAQAGIEEGDVILELNGTAVTAPRDLSRSVAALEVGSEATLAVLRRGERTEITVTVGERGTDMAEQPSETDPAEPQARLGLVLSPLPELLRRNLGLEEGQGLLIQRVEPQSPAGRAGLQPGDVILAAGNQPVGAAEELAAQWRQAREEGRPLLLRIGRAGGTVFVAVEPAAE